MSDRQIGPILALHSAAIIIYSFKLNLSKDLNLTYT